MNRIVRDSYPVGALPENLRREISPSAVARVTVEAIPLSEPARLLEQLFDRFRPSFSSLEEAADYIEAVRQERD